MVFVKEDGKLMWNDRQFAIPSATERLTQRFGRRLLEQAGLQTHPSSVPLTVLDLACGTAVITASLQEMIQTQPPEVFEIVCGDLAEAMVVRAQEKIEILGWKNTTAQVTDAQDTKLPSQHFSHIFTNFGPMLIPNPSAMLSECDRMLKPGGTCAFSTWKKIGWVEDVWDALNSMPDLPPCPSQEQMFSALSTGQWQDEGYIREQLVDHGFQGIRIETASDTLVTTSVEEMRSNLSPILDIVYRFWTADQRQMHGNQDTKDRINMWFRQKYPDGHMQWDWRALLTTSNKPT